MTVKILPLLECRYCDGGTGGILLDVPVAYDLSDRQADDESEADYHRKLLIHNSPLPDDGPCPHLLWGYYVVNRRHVWGVDFVWKCPSLRAETDDAVHEFLCDLIYGEEHEEFLPRTEHDFDGFGLEWHRGGDASQHVYFTHGRTAFADNIPQFLAELKSQLQRRDAAWAAGRNTHAEWREIVTKRKREMEYEYEEC